MLGVGFDTSTEVDGHALVTRYCPFGETATKHPEIVCRLDQGIVRGLLEATNQDALPIVIPHLELSEECYTDV